MCGPSGVLPRVLPFTQFYPGFTQLPRVKLGKTVQRFYPPTLNKHVDWGDCIDQNQRRANHSPSHCPRLWFQLNLQCCRFNICVLHYLNSKQTYGTVSLRPHYWHLCYQNCLWTTLCVLDCLLQYSVLLLNIIQHNVTDHRHILECEPRGNVIQFRCNIGIRVCTRCHAVDM